MIKKFIKTLWRFFFFFFFCTMSLEDGENDVVHDQQNKPTVVSDMEVCPIIETTKEVSVRNNKDVLYLKTKLNYPIYDIKCTVQSKDQGWASSNCNHGSFVQCGIYRNEKSLDSLRLYFNKRADRTYHEYITTLTFQNKFIQNLNRLLHEKLNNTAHEAIEFGIILSARYPGWGTHATYAKIEINTYFESIKASSLGAKLTEENIITEIISFFDGTYIELSDVGSCVVINSFTFIDPKTVETITIQSG
eukprot:619176_1